MRLGLAIAIILLGLAATARAETGGIAPDPARCEPDNAAKVPLTDTEIAYCRQLWREKVEFSRRRAASTLDAMIRSTQELRERAAVSTPPPVDLGTFLRDGNLAYGDVVVLPGGPRVFVGQSYEPVTADDFVALDSPRSPHRNGVGAYRGALPGPPPDQPPTRQERRQ